MSKTSKNTSLGVITGVFIFFLVLLGTNTFNEAYIQLKHSVVDEHIHAVLFYSLELIVLLFIYILGVKLCCTIYIYGTCKIITLCTQLH